MDQRAEGGVTMDTQPLVAGGNPPAVSSDDIDIVKRLRAQHTLQYGWKFGEVVEHTENNPDPYIIHRTNRCAICEQWSPCDVHIALNEIVRLRDEVGYQRHDIRELNDQIVRRDAEIERLRAERDAMRAEIVAMLAAWDARRGR